MPALNQVILLGNLTHDPELRYTPQGTAVCTLGLAVNYRSTTASGEARVETCFVDIDVWGQQAQGCSRYLRKGAPALVEGRLRLDQWDDRETGKRRSRLRVQAERVQFVGAPVGADFAESVAAGSSVLVGDGEVSVADPESGAAPTAAARPVRTPPRMPAFEPLPAAAGGAQDGVPF